MKILTICPSRRKEAAARMMASFFDTIKTDNTLRIIPEGTVTEAINSCFDQALNYDFVHITNDDVIYRTSGWDQIFVSLAQHHGHGVYYGDDLCQGKELCTFPFISVPLIRALGWIQESSLTKYFGDTVWFQLAGRCNCLYYEPKVVIEHLTWANGKSDEKPDTAIYNKDSIAYGRWLYNTEAMNVLTVRGVLNAS